ncbi:DUF2788 domain-containing protein [Paraferrimonas sp. SM1919]|uniref:DUF2788 domain-containing protein n=1 Tax=Paraferrimonas sp. SM1919 TaxID=2662263 RepID=UPI0013D79358|nr:DUF2788 domain-containing protein [Paraferrimonas sp. SM1919]
MLSEYLVQIETIGLNLFFAAIFFFIGMAIKDVLDQGNVPKIGKIAVWTVLFTGCTGFIAKGIIQFLFESGAIN